MRDKRFVAAHRGGLLSKKQHFKLIRWAIDCVDHILPLFGESIDKRLYFALEIAHAWERENATTSDARKASLGAIAVANESSIPVSIAVARAVGHAVATAHMADHSIRAADYSLKAIKISGKSVEIERKWQNDKIPHDIKELVLAARKNINIKRKPRIAKQ